MFPRQLRSAVAAGCFLLLSGLGACEELPPSTSSQPSVEGPDVGLMADQRSIALFRTAIGETLDYLASRDVPAPSTVVLDVHETLTNYQDFDGPLRGSHVRAAFTQLAEDGVLAQAQWREGSRSAEVTCEERERSRTLRNCSMHRGMLILEVAPGGAYWERALEGDLFVKVQMTYQILWSVNEDTAGFGFRWSDDQWHLSGFRAVGPE